MKRNVPLKRTGFAPKPRKQMRRTPIKKVSARKSKLDSKYSRLKREFMARPENRWCPVAMSGVLVFPGDPANLPYPRQIRTCDLHHVFRRGKFYLDVSTWMALSREGHDFVENNKAVARARGWLADSRVLQAAWLKKKSSETSCAVFEE